MHEGSASISGAGRLVAQAAIVPLALLVAGCLGGFGCRDEPGAASWDQPSVYVAAQQRATPGSGFSGTVTGYWGDIQGLPFYNQSVSRAFHGDVKLLAVSWMPSNMPSAGIEPGGRAPTSRYWRADPVNITLEYGGPPNSTAGMEDFLERTTSLSSINRTQLAVEWSRQPYTPTYGYPAINWQGALPLRLSALYEELGASQPNKTHQSVGDWTFEFDYRSLGVCPPGDTPYPGVHVDANDHVTVIFRSPESSPGTEDEARTLIGTTFAACGLPSPSFEHFYWTPATRCR
ncbi:MAG: hypothetical protein V4510_03535 [bacterium]